MHSPNHTQIYRAHEIQKKLLVLKMSDSVIKLCISEQKAKGGLPLGTLQISFVPASNKPNAQSMDERMKSQKILPVSLEATGMAVQDDLIVTLVNSNSEDEERHVAILHKHLGLCRVFVDVHLNNPSYVTMSMNGDRSIFVTEEHRVIKLNLEGAVVGFVGGPEPNLAPLNFYNPCGMAFNPISGQLYIADHSNHRIQVLNPDLSFAFVFSTVPQPAKDACSPTDIVFDSNGTLYIADDTNNCIMKYSAEGQYISMFSAYGSEAGCLNEPVYLAIDRNCLIYVCEIDGDRISVFDVNGYFQFVIKSDERMFITGLDVNTEGDLYLCDYLRKNVVVI